MSNNIELLVELKIPDTTTITTFHTLQRMGYNNLNKIRRLDYYKFNIAGDSKKFAEEIVKVDVLVNANKHKYYIHLDEKSTSETLPVLILVKNDYPETGLLSMLQNRLGFGQIKNMERGIIWKLYFKDIDKIKARNLAKAIAKKLLVNRHYQRFEVF